MRLGFNIQQSTAAPMGMFYLSPMERLAVVFIAGLTNISIIPALRHISKHNSNLHVFIGCFTVLTSTCYHIAEAMHGQRLFYLNEGNWHRLDNIGSIASFNLLGIYLLDIGVDYPQVRAFLEFFQLGLVMILQEWKPWDVRFTIYPIILFNAPWLIKYIILRKPCRWRMDKFKLALLSITPAVFCFYMGLDDRHDYLRIWHGMWHCLVGISSYTWWQIIPEGKPNIKTIYKNKYKTQTKNETQNNSSIYIKESDTGSDDSQTEYLGKLSKNELKLG